MNFDFTLWYNSAVPRSALIRLFRRLDGRGFIVIPYSTAITSVEEAVDKFYEPDAGLPLFLDWVGKPSLAISRGTLGHPVRHGREWLTIAIYAQFAEESRISISVDGLLDHLGEWGPCGLRTDWRRILDVVILTICETDPICGCCTPLTDSFGVEDDDFYESGWMDG